MMIQNNNQICLSVSFTDTSIAINDWQKLSLVAIIVGLFWQIAHLYQSKVDNLIEMMMWQSVSLVASLFSSNHGLTKILQYNRRKKYPI